MPTFGSTNRRPRQKQRTSLLTAVERAGNRLPEPLIIFVWLIAGTAVSSAILRAFGVSVEHPETGEAVPIQSILSGDGVRFVLEETVNNFVGFAPLGVVLTIMIGIGLADKVGLLGTFIRIIMRGVPVWFLPYAVFFVANTAVIASDAAYLIVPPLAATIYHALGRNPLAGIICAFVGSASGYASGIFITAIDPVMAGITNEAVAILGSGPQVTAVDNYFFMVASVVACTLVCGSITRWVVEPRLGPYVGDKVVSTEPVTPAEKRGLRAAGVVAIAYIGIVVAAASFPNSPLRSDEGSLVPSPLLSGIVPVLFGLFTLVGLTYGLTSGSIRSGKDAVDRFAEAMVSMRLFIVVIFFIAQFSAFFSWTNIGLFVSANGADFLRSINATGVGVLIGVTILAGIVTLVITSGSGLWAIVAPIFVPMLMQLGYHPAAVQMAYRIGDASVSVMTPLQPYMIVILGYIREWDPDKRLGSLVSNTLPYAAGILLTKTALFLLFYALELPLGPGVGFMLDVPPTDGI